MENMQDIYTWRVTYQDGTQLEEEDAASGFMGVDQERVKSVELIPAWGDDNHRVIVPSGAQPVFFRRRSLVINPTTEQTEQASTIHCIGWKREQDTVYLFVKDDGSTLLSNDLQAV